MTLMTFFLFYIWGYFKNKKKNSNLFVCALLH